MIIPTLNCPSNCKYCWGSENKKEIANYVYYDKNNRYKKYVDRYLVDDKGIKDRTSTDVLLECIRKIFRNNDE